MKFGYFPSEYVSVAHTCRDGNQTCVIMYCDQCVYYIKQSASSRGFEHGMTDTERLANEETTMGPMYVCLCLSSKLQGQDGTGDMPEHTHTCRIKLSVYVTSRVRLPLLYFSSLFFI